MIIDSLTHVTADGRWFHTEHDASEARLLREMDNASVDKAVVVALAEFISNEFVLEVCERHSDRLIPGASFNPRAFGTASQAARAVRAQLLGSPYRVLKLHPRLNRYDPLDPRCLSVLEELASWEAPMRIWLDTIFHSRGVTLRKPVVETIHEIVGRFPHLTFVLLHGGSTHTLQVVEAIREFENAYVDISLTMCRYSNTSVWLDLQFLLRRFDRRTVLGSDFPEYVMSDVLKCFRQLAQDISVEKCANILGANLSKVLK